MFGARAQIHESHDTKPVLDPSFLTPSSNLKDEILEHYEARDT